MKRALLTLSMFLIGILGTQAQSVSTWAGNPSGSAPNGSDKLSTKFSNPWGIAKDSKGNYWVTCDDSTGRILMITSGGKVYSRAGNPTSPITGFQDGAATSAEMNYSNGIAIEKDTIFFCDYGNNAVRKLSPYVSIGSSQKVTTIAGGGGNLGSTRGISDTTDGQGYGSKGAYFNGPTGLVINPYTHDIIIVDQSNSCIRGIKRTGKAYGTSYLLAGRKLGSLHKDGPPTNGAQFSLPTGIYIDSATGDLYVTEQSQQIRKIPFNSTTKKYDKNVTTVDVGAKTSPSTFFFGSVDGVVKAGSGTYASYYFANESNIFKNDLSGSGTTVLTAGSDVIDASTGSLKAGFKDGPGSIALFDNIFCLFYNGSNIILAADHNNNRIRSIDLTGTFTGVEEPKAPANGEGFKVYPNPAQDFVTIENFDISGTTTNIGLYDMTGKLVYFAINDFNGRFNIPLTKLPRGIYILKVQSDKANLTSKVIVK